MKSASVTAAMIEPCCNAEEVESLNSSTIRKGMPAPRSVERLDKGERLNPALPFLEQTCLEQTCLEQTCLEQTCLEQTCLEQTCLEQTCLEQACLEQACGPEHRHCSCP